MILYISKNDPGPAVRDDQGHGIGSLAFLVNEVDAEPINVAL